MSYLPWILFCNLLLANTFEAYKALAIFPLPSISHSILGDSLVKLLADAGNEVTYLTPFPRAKFPAKVRQIAVLEESGKKLWKDGLNLTVLLDRKSNSMGTKDLITMVNELHLQTLQKKEVQKVINDPKEKFDVIIAVWFYSDIYTGLAPIFDCPFIWLLTTEQHWKILHLVDGIPNPAYNADTTFNNLPPLSFLQRVQELGFVISGLLSEYFYGLNVWLEQYQTIIAPCIRKRGKRVPDFEELRFNASLVLGNSDVSLGTASRLPLLYKPIAGYHISNDTDPLTGDLKILLDNAKHGVIYFSLGSNLNSETFPVNLKNNLLNMFGRLKQTVLWKFESDIPNKPSNVHILKWAPQKSILAHQNCILFITHGGFLSMIEAIHFGKPFIGIPVFGDQFSNVARAVQKGFAKRVELSYTLADNIHAAVHEIINNPSYAAKAKEFSFIYFHRPSPPAAELVHWVDHVVRTRGALHLRSPALHVPWYQKLYLDLVIVIFITIFGLKMLFMRICFMLCKKDRSKKKKKN